MLTSLLFFSAVAAVLAAVGGAYTWLTSAPPLTRRDPLSNMRRALHTRIEARHLRCNFCGAGPEDTSGYCSEACGVYDAEMQAIR